MKWAALGAAAVAVALAAAAYAAPRNTTANGRILYTESYGYSSGYGSLYAVNPDGSGRVLIAKQAVNGSWSRDGRHILLETTRNGDVDLWTVNADGSSQKELTFSIGTDADGAWSPDGTKIAFESNRNNPSGADVFVVNADGSAATRLTDATGFNGDPTWSPDGTKIAYTSDAGGSKDVWVMNADGSGKTRLTTDGGTDENPAWSPDGTTIAFDTDRSEPGNLDVWAMEANGVNQHGVNQHALIASPALDALPAWSPDGKQIAFASERAGKGARKIYVAGADGTGVHLLVGAARPFPVATLPSWGARPAGDPCTIEGTFRADRLVGTKHGDVICGGAGNDTIFARGGGRDVVYGGPGRDVAHVDRTDRTVGVERRLYR